MVEKWIPPTMSETAKIGQKTEGILGVNPQNQSTMKISIVAIANSLGKNW
jgi:hypothetical protein